MMIATGVLTKYDRIELIEGDMLDMAPIGLSHMAITSRLHEFFVLAAGRSATVVSGDTQSLVHQTAAHATTLMLRHNRDGGATRAAIAAIAASGDLARLVEG
jgi:hypothetical protein